MKPYLLALAAVAALGVYTLGAAQAQYYQTDRQVVVERGGGPVVERVVERRVRRPRTKTVYVIEGGRPVRRVVYVDGRGRYYREERGQQIFIQERVFKSYPNRYFLRDGRRREGITFDIR